MGRVQGGMAIDEAFLISQTICGRGQANALRLGLAMLPVLSR